ncbi:MAG: DNA primase [Actinobacteria bacterium]|nr:DNA primase [Actinomycetota bacterium]
MAGLIRQEDVEAVRERSDLVKVVSGHLQLKKTGRDSLSGLCPFHPEKTPSFSVSPSKQVYYCFGCGEGGNVFRFLERTEGLSFAEAVEKLAREVGLTLRYEGQTQGDRRAQGRRQVLFRALADAARMYTRVLLEGREGADARSYLDARGFSPASVERFGVGYAPGYPDYLLKRMSKAYSVDLLVAAGLAARDGSGNLRDRFRGRVMFPVHDLAGNAVGFGGRLLEGPQAPTNVAKYVNSPDGEVYHKGTLLYNLNRAKADITRSGRAWLVEGYTDVMALHQSGVPEAVATCGTALGEDHVRLLSRFTQKLVLAFDSDEAGARAAERAYQFHERYPVEVSVLVLPDGQDPADFALSHGEGAAEALLELEGRATPLVVYMIERVMRGRNLTDVEEQSRAARAGVSIISALEDPVRRERYARVLADKVGVNVAAVLLELERAAASHDGSRASPAGPIRMPPGQRVEREVLKLLVQAPEACAGLTGRLDPEQFSRAEHRKAFELIREDGSPATGAGSLVAMAQDRSDQLGRLFAALAVEPLETVGEATPDYVQRTFLRFEEFAVKRQVDEVRKRLEKMNPLRSTLQYDDLYEEFVKLEGARRRIRAAQDAIQPGA